VVLWRLDTSSHLLLGPSHANAVSCLAPALTAKGDELLHNALFNILCMHATCLFADHDGGQVVLWRLDTSSHLLLGPSHANAVSCLALALTAKGDELLHNALIKHILHACNLSVCRS
jgi:hypothetical protein